VNPVLSTIRHFPEEYRAKLVGEENAETESAPAAVPAD
jgi:hypothetical protein